MAWYYAGDEGGILLHTEREGARSRVVVSLTPVQIRRALPFAAAALAYQRRRIKKLKARAQR